MLKHLFQRWSSVKKLRNANSNEDLITTVVNLNYKGNKFSWNAIITLSSPLENALTESHVANDEQPVGKLASTSCSGTHLQVNMIQCMAAQGWRRDTAHVVINYTIVVPPNVPVPGTVRSLTSSNCALPNTILFTTLASSTIKEVSRLRLSLNTFTLLQILPMSV